MDYTFGESEGAELDAGTVTVAYECKLTGTVAADCTVTQTQILSSSTESATESTIISDMSLLGAVPVTSKLSRNHLPRRRANTQEQSPLATLQRRVVTSQHQNRHPRPRRVLIPPRQMAPRHRMIRQPMLATA